jgi:hypothetical protein
MKIKTNKRYEISFNDSEIVEALVHWLSVVRGRTDAIEMASHLHSSEPKVVRKKGCIVLRFETSNDKAEI